MSKHSKRFAKAMRKAGFKVKDVKPGQGKTKFMGFVDTSVNIDPELIAEAYRVIASEPNKTETVGHAHTPEPEQPMFDMLMDVAASLLDVESGQPNEEYARGICELIGRVRCDHLGEGDGTAENALEVADALGVDDLYSKRATFVRSPNKAQPETEVERRVRALEAKVEDEFINVSELTSRVTNHANLLDNIIGRLRTLEAKS